MPRDELPVFAYWDGQDRTPLEGFAAEWSAGFPRFQIFGDEEVLPLLERHFPEYVELYQRIRIPTARSDIARLLLLFEHGGFYVDCHIGKVDVASLQQLLTSLDQHELILVERSTRDGEFLPGARTVVNGAVFARPRSDLFHVVCRRALKNLTWHEAQEHVRGPVAYSIWFVCGTWTFNAVLLEAACLFREVREPYRGRIHVIKEDDAPFERNVHRTFGLGDDHWSVREKSELLFTPRVPVA